MPECSNTSVKSKNSDTCNPCSKHLAATFSWFNSLSRWPTPPPAASSDTATTLAQSKHLLPKTAPCSSKKKLQIQNCADLFNNFSPLSTPADNITHGVERHNPRFHWNHVKDATLIADVCLADVWLEALWGPTNRNCFLFVSRALALETIPTICYELVTLCCLAWVKQWQKSQPIMQSCHRFKCQCVQCCKMSSWCLNGSTHCEPGQRNKIN